jgi:hypothetical protein
MSTDSGAERVAPALQPCTDQPMGLKDDFDRWLDPDGRRQRAKQKYQEEAAKAPAPAKPAPPAEEPKPKSEDLPRVLAFA